MVVKIVSPKNHENEKRYIFELLFTEFLGLEIDLIFENCQNYNITINEIKIVIEDHFFVKVNSLPKSYLDSKYLPSDIKRFKNEFNDIELVSLFGIPEIINYNNEVLIKTDIIANVFFMISRWEELVSIEKDYALRFAGRFSNSYKENYLDKPIVDEYVELLRCILNKYEQNLYLKQPTKSIFVSCDVDVPFDITIKSFNRAFKVVISDLIKRKSIKLAINRIKTYYFNKKGNYKYDKNYTFDRYMDICDKNHLKASFYFITNHIEPNNCDYDINSKEIIDLLKKINKRGHEIGLHGSFQSFNDFSKIIDEKLKLESVLKENKIIQKIKGNRQHYLRYDISITPDILDEAGFEYDSTGGYSDLPGFRFGTSNEFHMWSWSKMSKIKLKQRPLIAMECSVIDKEYMGKGIGEDTLKIFIDMKRKSIKYGNFSILWHNSHFHELKEFEIFEKVISTK